jgi:hypothetical protein
MLFYRRVLARWYILKQAHFANMLFEVGNGIHFGLVMSKADSQYARSKMTSKSEKLLFEVGNGIHFSVFALHIEMWFKSELPIKKVI